MRSKRTALITLLTLMLSIISFAQNRSALPEDRLSDRPIKVGRDASTDITAGRDPLAPSLDGTINVGTGQTYTSLTNAGGAFEALNSGGATSNITFLITSDLTAETGAVKLNEVAGSYTVTIKPSGAARTITGTSAASSGIIILNGTDNVTIDGSLSGGTDRSLTLSNTTTTSTVIWITDGTNGATGNTVKNCVIQGSGANVVAGIIAGSGTTFGTASAFANSNNTISNNEIKKAQNGAYLFGVATTLDQNWQITGNTFSTTVAADQNNFRGMLLANANNSSISGNTIPGVTSTSTSTATMHGIQIAGTVTNSSLVKNKISKINQINTGGWGASGVTLGQASTTANLLIANNFISDVTGYGYASGIGVSDNGYGITVSAGAGYKIYDNTINMNANQTATGGITGALNIISTVTTSGGLDIRGNIFSMSATTGTRYCVIAASTALAAVYGDINYNDYYTTQNVGRSGATATAPTNYATLTDWKTFTAKDANSLSTDPLLVSASDLHLQSSSPVQNMGVVLAGVTDDIDGNTRSTTLPEMGADELAPVGPPASSSKGRVTDAAGNGVSGATVTVTLGATTLGLLPTYKARTNPLGYYEIVGLTSGTAYTMSIAAKGTTFTDPVRTFTFNPTASDQNFTVAP